MTRVQRVVLIALAIILLSACAPGRNELQQAQTHYALGVSYLREPNVTAALREFIKAAELDPENHRIQEVLAQTYHLKKAYPEAEKHYLEAIRLSGGDPAYVNNLAALYLDLQRWDESIARFQQAAGDLLFAQPEVALTGAGTAYLQKGDHLEAIEYFQRALEKNRRYAPAELHLGKAYQALGKMIPALAAYQDAVEIDPSYAEAFYQMGLVHMKLDQRDEARKAFEKTISLRPDSEWGRLAKSYLQLL